MAPQKPAPERIDPADLAAGYMFPELFSDEPFHLIGQEAVDSPFTPSAAVQHSLPDMPSPDWEHIRRTQTAKRQAHRRRRPTPAMPTVFVAPAQPDTDGAT